MGNNKNQPPIALYLDIDGVLNTFPYDTVYLKDYRGRGWKEDAPYLTKAPYAHTAHGLVLPTPEYDWKDKERISAYYKPLPDDIKNEYFAVDTTSDIEIEDMIWGSGNLHKTRIQYSQELISELKDLEAGGQIEIIWCTTWKSEAPKKLAPILKIGEQAKYVPLNPPGFRERNFTHEKRQVMEYLLGDIPERKSDFLLSRYDEISEARTLVKEERPVIWIDDQATATCPMRPKKGQPKEEYWLDVRGLRYDLSTYHPVLARRYKERKDILSICTDPRYGITRLDISAIRNFITRFGQ